MMTVIDHWVVRCNSTAPIPTLIDNKVERDTTHHSSVKSTHAHREPPYTHERQRTTEEEEGKKQICSLLKKNGAFCRLLKVQHGGQSLVNASVGHKLVLSELILPCSVL